MRTAAGAALTSIRVGAGAIPAVAMLAAGAVMLAYPLGAQALRRMVGELADRGVRDAGAAAPV